MNQYSCSLWVLLPNCKHEEMQSEHIFFVYTKKSYVPDLGIIHQLLTHYLSLGTWLTKDPFLWCMCVSSLNTIDQSSFTVDKCRVLKWNISIYYLHTILKRVANFSCEDRQTPFFSLWTIGSAYRYYCKAFVLSKKSVSLILEQRLKVAYTFTSS